MVGPSPRSEHWDEDWRRSLVDNLGIIVHQLWIAGVGEIFADGSFCEDKDHPNDLFVEAQTGSDCLDEFIASLDIDRLEESLGGFLARLGTSSPGLDARRLACGRSRRGSFGLASMTPRPPHRGRHAPAKAAPAPRPSRVDGPCRWAIA